METIKTFTAPTELELWQQVATDMARQETLLHYAAELQQAGQTVYFDIDIDLGGGFEGGLSTTNFLAPVPGNPSLRLHLHQQDWINEIGTIFGMEDIKIGHPDLDKAFIIRTNQPEALRTLFTDPAIHSFLLEHQDCEIELKQEGEDGTPQLSFSKDDAILNPAELRKVYHWLREMINRIEK